MGIGEWVERFGFAAGSRPVGLGVKQTQTRTDRSDFGTMPPNDPLHGQPDYVPLAKAVRRDRRMRRVLTTMGSPFFPDEAVKYAAEATQDRAAPG